MVVMIPVGHWSYSNTEVVQDLKLQYSVLSINVYIRQCKQYQYCWLICKSKYVPNVSVFEICNADNDLTTVVIKVCITVHRALFIVANITLPIIYYTTMD